MPLKFKKHYTVEQARELLPQVRKWLAELGRLRLRVTDHDQRLAQILAGGCDAGGEMVNDFVRSLAGIKKLLARFQEREIQIKDLDRGLIDFPAFLGSKEIFLCWEQDEDDI